MPSRKTSRTRTRVRLLTGAALAAASGSAAGYRWDGQTHFIGIGLR